jgi:uncharacterized membrane protein YtjA (UPF0391 family)
LSQRQPVYTLRTFHSTPGEGGVDFAFHADKEAVMLYWALVFFIISIIAAVFGFTGIAAATAGIAKILFFIFVVLFVLALIFGMRRRPQV